MTKVNLRKKYISVRKVLIFNLKFKITCIEKIQEF